MTEARNEHIISTRHPPSSVRVQSIRYGTVVPPIMAGPEQQNAPATTTPTAAVAAAAAAITARLQSALQKPKTDDSATISRSSGFDVDAAQGRGAGLANGGAALDNAGGGGAPQGEGGDVGSGQVAATRYVGWMNECLRSRSCRSGVLVRFKIMCSVSLENM